MAGEIDAIAVVETELSAHKVDSIGMLDESSITNFTASECETHNGEESHNDVSCLTVLSTPADISEKIEVENCIQPCCSQPCLETLESSPVDNLNTRTPPDNIGVLGESSLPDSTVSGSGYEKQNGEENGNDANDLPVASASTENLKKSEGEHCIQLCSSQACLETLESLHIDDLSTNKPPESIGGLEESSTPDFTASGPGFEKQNSEENDNGANFLPVANDPTENLKKTEGEHCIQLCSTQPCLETLESSPVDDLSTHKLPERIGVLEESSNPDFTASGPGFEKQNSEENDNGANFLPVANDPTENLKKTEGEHCIQLCSTQPCLETLESSPVDDLSTHKLPERIGVLEESSNPDFTASGPGFEKQNSEENGDDANFLPVASAPTDTLKTSEGEHCIQPCSSQPALEILESSAVVDSSTHKPPDSIGVLEESPIPDYTVSDSGFEKQNSEESGNDANCLPVVSAPTDTLEKSEGIQPCSSQPSPETRGSLPLDDSSTQKSPNGTGMPEELSIIDYTVSSSQVQIGEGNRCDINCLPVVSALTDTSKESEAENCIQPCSSQPCLETLESSPLDDSLCNCIHENERREDKSAIKLFEEGVSGVVEEESDVTTEIKDETLDQKLCVEGDEFRVKEDLPEIPPKSLELCCRIGITENRSSGKLDASCPENVVFGGVSPCPAAELHEQKGNEGKDLAGNSNPTVLFNDSPLFSCVSGWVHESSHKTKPKRASRKSKNKAQVQDLHILFGEWQRRTRSSKPARSSKSGWLGNIEKYFEHNNRLGLNEIHIYETGGKKLGQESRKRNKSRANGSTQGSRQKKNTSTGGIRLKVKVGKEVCKSIAVSDAFDTSAFRVGHFGTKSQAGISSEAPRYASSIGDKIGADGIAKQLQCFDNKLTEVTSQSDISFLDLHQADKDLEGAGHAGGDCPGLPSHIRVEGPDTVIQKRYTDPGTSPDSEVINLVPDSQASTRSPENLSDTVSPSKVFAPTAISDSKIGNTKDIVSDVSDRFGGDIFRQTEHANKSKTKKQQRSKKSRDDEIFSPDILKSCMDANGLPKISREASKGRSKISGKTRNKNGCKKQGKERKSVNQKKVKEKNCRDDHCEKEDDTKAGSCALGDIGKIISNSNVAALEVPCLDLASSNTAEQQMPVDNAWVRCDDCHKWRRIPVALVDAIGQTNCEWTCKDNTDKDYADCSIAQEKSNEAINAELGISDADEDAYDAPSKSKGLEFRRPSFMSNEHEFTLISSNQFLHRSRKTQTIDEIMVCHCKLPCDGEVGCGDECLNRMLNIECVQGTCPCGDLCSNQQFQKRNYAKMKWERCGKKGFGLRSEEDIPKGHFLIEYVGEVLDMHTYEARQREYAFNSHKHFYFMTLNGSEVIDACAKGNLGRFINHSCDPNCRTEKWVVNGEICIGLFALRDIKKGEEVTFDYNYVRVCGAAAKKCYCGSSNCRGYIGGDPTSAEVIDQVDSDEEFLEPVMLEEGKTGSSFKNRKPRSSSLTDESVIADGSARDTNKTDHPEVPEMKSEFASEIQDAVDQSNSSKFPLNPPLEYDDLKEMFPSYCQPVGISESSSDVMRQYIVVNQEMPMENQRSETSPSNGLATKLKSKSSSVEEKRVFMKSRFLIKTSRESSSSKKGKVASNHLNASRLPMLPNKSQMLSIKPKKFMHGTSNGRLETVEDKLNELLDNEGGISKRKDAAKGYLKFLVHTAASGASGNGEAIQSNRDLSMILDALLKTKSKAVLVDIINKNGLRMLHNMLKQYRKDFKKTPILRKLLKGLEYLAVKEILTQEHINGGPPCPGMESFRDSMLSLTEHDDKQVHQIARNFRDRWIPRHYRRHGNMDRDDRRMDYHKRSNSTRIHNHVADVVSRPAEAIDCATQAKPPTTPVDPAASEASASGGTQRRKRKTRWDQPALPKPSDQTGKDMLDHVEKETRESYCPHCALNYGQQDETSSADTNSIQSDVPPGFSPVASSTVTNPSEHNGGLKFPDDMVVGHPQKKFDSRYPVSYGIPMPIMQQFEAPEGGTNWDAALGVPFHPFPPLPPFPPHKNETRNLAETTENQQNNLSSTCSNHTDAETPVENEQHSAKRARASHDLGKRYFRQQKWNRAQPPWIRGYSRGVGNVAYEQRNSFYSQAGDCQNQQNSDLN